MLKRPSDAGDRDLVRMGCWVFAVFLFGIGVFCLLVEDIKWRLAALLFFLASYRAAYNGWCMLKFEHLLQGENVNRPSKLPRPISSILGVVLLVLLGICFLTKSWQGAFCFLLGAGILIHALYVYRKK